MSEKELPDLSGYGTEFGSSIDSRLSQETRNKLIEKVINRIKEKKTYKEFIKDYGFRLINYHYFKDKLVDYYDDAEEVIKKYEKLQPAYDKYWADVENDSYSRVPKKPDWFDNEEKYMLLSPYNNIKKEKTVQPTIERRKYPDGTTLYYKNGTTEKVNNYFGMPYHNGKEVEKVGGKRKSRRNRKSKKGKMSRKARKSRRKSNRRRGRR
jgi:hypothetical protein